MRAPKKQKVPEKVVQAARAATPLKPVVQKTPANEKKAKVVAALKRLHPMD